MRKIMVLGFALVIFTGTIGVNVFAHFCKVDGVDYSYILPPSHSCGMEEEVEESCCHKDEKSETHQAEIKKDCCKIAVSSFKISSDYTQKASTDLVFAVLPTKAAEPVYCKKIDVEPAPSLSGEVTRPPPKTGQEILILNQVFRI